jgi:hypothetical protein
VKLHSGMQEDSEVAQWTAGVQRSGITDCSTVKLHSEQQDSAVAQRNVQHCDVETHAPAKICWSELLQEKGAIRIAIQMQYGA